MDSVTRPDLDADADTIVALRGFHRGDLTLTTSWEADLLQQVAAVSRHLGDRLQAGRS